MRTIIGLLMLALASPAFAYFSLLDAPRTRCERCLDRCRRNACAGEPTPTPRPTATPTPVPLPCEPMGIKVFAGAGDAKMLCFAMASGPGVVEVSSQNHGNASCAMVEMEVTAPSGTKSYSYGVQPGVAMLPREGGRYYVYVRWLEGTDSQACRTYTFGAR